jgi:hypothetical protein
MVDFAGRIREKNAETRKKKQIGCFKVPFFIGL